MSTFPQRGRTILLACALISAIISTAGIQCPDVNLVLNDEPHVIVEPPGNTVVAADAFGLDLVNDTAFAVDPGVTLEGYLLDLGVLDAFEGSDLAVAFDVDCFAHDVLTIDPTFFMTGDLTAVAANAPLTLQEGIDYSCGDILTLEFSQDQTGTLYVDVAVNGVFITF